METSPGFVVFPSQRSIFRSPMRVMMLWCRSLNGIAKHFLLQKLKYMSLRCSRYLIQDIKVVFTSEGPVGLWPLGREPQNLIFHYSGTSDTRQPIRRLSWNWNEWHSCSLLSLPDIKYLSGGLRRRNPNFDAYNWTQQWPEALGFL